MATGVVSWSKTAATNATADSAQNWAEGMAPSAVNDSARGGMASVAKYRDDTAGTLTTGGTSTAYTVSTNQGFATLAAMDGAELAIKFNAANGAAPTLAVDGLTAKPINVNVSTAVGTGVIAANSIWSLTYDNSNSIFVLRAVPASVQDGTVNTASLAASAVTYAKVQNVTDQRLLGNFSGSATAPSEYSVTGPTVSGSAISFPFPIQGAFKNLSIKVASTTTVTVAADFVVTTNGSGAYQTTAVSSTINLGTTGADALDTGSIAIDTWYAIWVVAKSDGTTKCVASTSSSSPTMPSGYTFKARIGWVKTIHASATLYGTWQLGREARYVVGLAQTSTLPSMASGTSIGNPTTGPTWVSVTVNGGNVQQSFVPSTASQVQVVLASASNFQISSLNVAAAPNNSYGAVGSTTNPPPIFYVGGQDGAAATRVGCGLMANLILESSAVYWAVASSATTNLFCYGWTDNI